MNAPGTFVGPLGPADITVIVVTYNSGGDIEELLDDLRSEACENLIRVVVVDNDSSDHTTEVVAEQEDVILVAAGGNLGYAGGINVGRRRVGDSRAVLILNPDLRVRPGAVGTLLRGLDHSRVGVVVPKIVDEEGMTFPSLRHEPSVSGILGDSLFGHYIARRNRRWSETVWNRKHYEYGHEIEWATGAALLIRTEIDRAVGDWDESYFLYSEEVDFCRRVRSAGATIRFEPHAVVEHRGGGSGSSSELAALMAVNRLRYFRRYHGELESSCYRAMVILGELLRSYDSGHRRTLRMLCNSERWTDLPKATPAPLSISGVALGAVIVPAHNEAAVIGRTLQPLAAAVQAGVIELVVVCNGCTDNTAEVARTFEGVTVLETSEASKITALNLGDATAALWPRLYLDADIAITIDAVAQVFEALRSGSALAARPSSKFDAGGADPLVRSYYRARSRIAWFRTALWGAGAYGLSEAGHRRIGQFPARIGDDLWVDAQFADDEKCVVETNPTSVVVPRDHKSLLHMLTRVYRGKAEVTSAPKATRTLRALIRSVRGPQTAWDAGVYAAMTIGARRRARVYGVTSWERDDSSRTPLAV